MIKIMMIVNQNNEKKDFSLCSQMGKLKSEAIAPEFFKISGIFKSSPSDIIAIAITSASSNTWMVDSIISALQSSAVLVHNAPQLWVSF